MTEHRDGRLGMLRHFPTLLARWRGGNASLHSLTSSHRAIKILITKSGADGNLQLACLGPIAISGPFEWNDSDITIGLSENGGFVVRDATAGFELETESVEIAENRQIA